MIIKPKCCPYCKATGVQIPPFGWQPLIVVKVKKRTKTRMSEYEVRCPSCVRICYVSEIGH